MPFSDDRPGTAARLADLAVGAPVGDAVDAWREPTGPAAQAMHVLAAVVLETTPTAAELARTASESLLGRIEEFVLLRAVTDALQASELQPPRRATASTGEPAATVSTEGRHLAQRLIDLLEDIARVDDHPDGERRARLPLHKATVLEEDLRRATTTLVRSAADMTDAAIAVEDAVSARHDTALLTALRPAPTTMDRATIDDLLSDVLDAARSWRSEVWLVTTRNLVTVSQVRLTTRARNATTKPSDHAVDLLEPQEHVETARRLLPDDVADRLRTIASSAEASDALLRVRGTGSYAVIDLYLSVT